MKKNTVRGLLMALCLGAALTANAQTPEQKAKIIEQTDIAAVKAMSKEAHARFETNYKRALELAEQNGWPLKIEDKENGTVAVLSGVRENGGPIYKGTSNLNSAYTSRVHNLRDDGFFGYDLAGQDMLIGMWEIGAPRKTHVELSGRITTGDNSSSTADNEENFHATHVAGTLMGSGSLDENAKGIAYQANLLAYDSLDDLGEAADAIEEDGLLISNHSYGLIFGFAEDWEPGAYTQEARDWDALHVAAPYYQAVMAAGNDREGNEKDELLQEKNAKNVIVVSAVFGLSAPTGYTGPLSVEQAPFSTWGPTDDRRIKPDISAKGMGVYSCDSESNTAHFTTQGTSMASPGVAGALTLFQQHYMNLHGGTAMRAATLKGLMSHTADEAGAADGPDFKFGWGLINATKAVLLMDADNADAPTALIDERVFTAADSEYEIEVTVSGDAPLKATIAWTDPAGPANNGTANSTTPRLVNDLDLRIYKMNGEEEVETFFPWRLANVVTDPAEKGDNVVDNIEVVEILDPEPGTYKIYVTYKENLQSFANQRYSLIVDEFVQFAGMTDNQLATMLSVYPNPAKDMLNIRFDSSIDTSDCVITLYDMQGRQVKLFDKYVETVNVSDLSSGVYMLNIATYGAKTTRKIVIE